MSELEEHLFCECDECIRVYRGPLSNEMSPYYLKSEADKVIEEKDDIIDELKEHIDELQKATDSAWSKVNAIYDELRHQKYKRCLAMAKWCRESLRLMRTYEVTEDFWNLEPGQDAEYFCKKGDFYSKWRKRWLALAEEPTWAKFLQLIHKEAK